jgi:multiple sugar transport system ATP-binding protein
MSGLELRSVVKRFGTTTVVEHLDLKIEEGEFIVLLGESGCGKSTTLRMIAGLESVTEGQVHIGGRDVTQLAPAKRDIAMVFQSYALYPHMNVSQNLSFALRLAGLSAADIEQRVNAAAKTLNIEKLLTRKPKELSGGQRQRVAIGRAIVREPEVFLFDEPLSNLDAKLRGHMRAELALLHERLGKTTVYVTHDQIEAMTLASRIVIFDKGRIQQIGTPAEVFAEPANLFVASFIGTPTMNLADGPYSMRLIVDVVEYLGTESVLVGRLATDPRIRLTVVAPGDCHSLVHQTVAIGFDPDALHLFDTGTTLRLGTCR